MFIVWETWAPKMRGAMDGGIALLVAIAHSDNWEVRNGTKVLT